MNTRHAKEGTSIRETRIRAAVELLGKTVRFKRQQDRDEFRHAVLEPHDTFTVGAVDKHGSVALAEMGGFIWFSPEVLEVVEV